MMTSILLGILYFVLSLIFGYMISRKYLKLKGLLAISIGFILINFLIPLMSFSFSILLGTNINYFTVFLSMGLLFSLILKDFFRIIKFRTNISNISIKLMISFMIIFTIYFVSYQGPFTGYWDTYIAAPAITLTGHNIDFVDIDNNRIYNYTLSGVLPDDLIDRDSFGIISKDQRLGSGITFSIPFLFFGFLGFRLYYALFISFGFIMSFFIFKKFVKSNLICFVTAFSLFFNGYILSINSLNPNLQGLIISLPIIFLLLSNKKNWFVVGLLFGLFGSIRNTAIIFSLPIGYLLLKEQKSFFFKMSFFLLGVFMILVPILYWNSYAFDNPFIHSSQYAHFEGFRPEFTHNFLGKSFEFNGLFNYPLNLNIVRTPHYVFPVYVYLLLLIVKIFGIFSLVVLFSIPKFFKKNRVVSLFLLLWLIPFLLFISFQENWEVAKTTFILANSDIFR